MGVLEVTLHEAENIREIRSEGSLAASKLLEAIGHLTVTTRTELKAINGSAHLIRQSLELQIEEANQPWRWWLIKILGLIYWGRYLA